MRIVVTGATGFIGSHLCRALTGRGDEVVALTRKPDRAGPRLPSSVRSVGWSPPEVSPSWAQELDGVDGVVNLAGEPVADRPWTAQQKERIARSRIDATTAIVEAMDRCERPPTVLVSGSAVGYYGSRGDEKLTEDSPPAQDFLATVVDRWEEAARAAEELGVRVTLLRTAGMVLGTDGGALPRLALPFKLFMGGILGPPVQLVSWIHIEDEVGLILLALERADGSGPLNAVAPHPVDMRSFSHSLGRALHRPVWAPGIPLAVRLMLGERASVVFASQNVIPARAEQLGYRFRYPTLDEALSNLYP